MDQLKPKQIQAANLLASGKLCKDVAKEVGVTQQTISAWKKDPVFTVYINQLKLEYAESIRESLRPLAKDAVSTLGSLVNNSKSDEVKRKAAINILETVGLYGSPEDCAHKFTWGIGPVDLDYYQTKEEKQLARMLKEISGN